MDYSISQIKEIIGAKADIKAQDQIQYISTDSRSISFPEKALFVALQTQRNDGHKYIPELYRKGVRSFLVDHLPQDTEEMPDANFLQVENTLSALQTLAFMHRKKFQIPIIGITGSNGKTIVKEWLYQLLHEDFRITRSPRSYNSQIGVPLSLFLLNEESECGIIEAGISIPGEMERLAKMICPTIGILTNIGEAHQENFSSLQEKCIEKCILFKNCEVLIYCSDNILINRAVKMSHLTCKLFFWSQKESHAPLYISKIVKGDSQTTISYVYQNKTSSLSIPYTDEASIENAIHCLALLLYRKMDTEKIAARMLSLDPVAMRLEVKEGKNNCTLIDDSYNSDLNSLAIALDFQLRRTMKKETLRTVILSDILQSGMPLTKLYTKVAHLLTEKGVNKFIGIGPDISSQKALFTIESSFYTNTDSFITSQECQSLRNQIVLIKGARIFHFEKIFEHLSQKVHETILEVNLSHLIDNFNHYRAKLKPQTKIVAMVKAFAYGAGSYEIAKSLQDQHCDYLAVAVADEGAELRKAGIHIPLMVMNPEMGSFPTLFDNSLEPEVYSFKLLHALIKAAEKEGITNYPIHLKLDTGMHRLGFTAQDIPEIIRIFQNQKALMICSVFSHLAGSDEPIYDEFTHQQIDLFKQATDQLQSAFSHKIIRHILNTAGIERFTDNQMEMVRLGIGLYGISFNPKDAALLKNVSTLRTTILQIKDIPATETVGYSRKGKLTRPSRIAAIPIGYADGLNRHLGNGKGCVYVNGHLAPFIGNICMDVAMIDVTDISVQEGDSVIIFGEELPVSVIAEKLNTIPYEIITSVSSRVKRVYYQE